MVVKADKNGTVKRVATLYRVSTKKQLDQSSDKNGGDIPNQRKACRTFIESNLGWQLVNEYEEKGVSGFKTRAEDRDVIQRAKEDALKGHYDVLLVYMFDRLGRIDDETPFVLQWFVENGIEMWSVTEGQQKIDGHADKLMNYIRFWQASGESIKTSIRVNEKHSQMVEAGEYRGGTVPFGYKTEKSGNFNKKGKELLKVVIDPEEAEIIKWMYDLVDQEGYGQYRIAQLLNEKGVKTKKGKSWASNSVNVLLRNPIYKGYMVYARGSEKEVMSNEQILELTIVDEAKWERVQAIRASRNPENTKNKAALNVIQTTKSSLLLIGMIRCGHCGNALTTTWNRKRYKMKDGTEKIYRTAKYRCSGKALQKVKCGGQTIHAQSRLEGLVLDEVYGYLDHVQAIDLKEKLKEMKKHSPSHEETIVTMLKNQLKTLAPELSALKKEVLAVIMGKSSFDRDMLNDMIQDKENEILEIQTKLKAAQQALDSKEMEQVEVEALQTSIPKWRVVFDQASIEKKKMMLSTIIDCVVVHREGIEIKFKLRIGQFIDAMGVTEIREKYSRATINKVLEYTPLSANA
ncbi:recombinase family protein [Brevibacillus brevis]|uniref:recombinase family protein n=1 Tax=Brevibacillus brevis TaxID=1393 RepID=UPI0037CC6520